MGKKRLLFISCIRFWASAGVQIKSIYHQLIRERGVGEEECLFKSKLSITVIVVEVMTWHFRIPSPNLESRSVQVTLRRRIKVVC